MYLLTILGSSVDSFYQADSYPSEGDFSHAKFIKNCAGGPCLNVGCVASSKQVVVKALDMLNHSSLSDVIIKELEDNNVDTSNIIYDDSVSDGNVLIITTGDKRTMFVVDPVRGYYQVDEKMQNLLNNATYIYSLMHMINRSFANLQPLKIAKEHGAKVIFDGTSKYEDATRAEMLYQLADGLFINTTDYQNLKKVSKREPIEILLENGCEFICVTDGCKGATCYSQNGVYKADSCKIDVVDSTGAGDSFAGCFLACRLKGYSYQKSLRLACLNGAYACMKFGATSGICSEEELVAFGQQHNYEIGD